MFFYTYLLLGEDGRFYYGHRSSDCPPEEDDYMGSCFDSTFKPIRKRVLSTFPCVDLAIIEEMRIHVTKNVGPNSRYANGVTLTPRGLSRKGVPVSKETREKMRKAHLGKSHSDEVRKKLREKQLGIPKPLEQRQNMSKARSGKRRFLAPDGRLLLVTPEQAPKNSVLVSAWITHDGETVWTTREEARAMGWRYASTVRRSSQS